MMWIINIDIWSAVLAKKDLLGNVETGGSFCSSKHETSEFRVRRGGNKAKSSHSPELQEKNFDLFRYPLGRMLFFEEKRGSGELVDIQELPPSSSRNFHLHVLEFRQRQQLD